MSFRVFPTENNVGIASGNEAQVIREALFAPLFDRRGKSPLTAFVDNGLTLTTVSNSLAVDVAVGTAVINGFLVSILGAAERISGLAASRAITAPNFIYLQYSTDGNGLVNSASLVSNTTGVAPANSVLVGIAATDANQATTVVNSAPAPHPYEGSYVGNGATDRLIFLGWKPKLVIVTWYDTILHWTMGHVTAASVSGDPDIGFKDAQPANLNSDRPKRHTHGFIVSGNSPGTLNQNTEDYGFMAIA